MSVVIGMIHNGIVRMGADSVTVRGDVLETPSHRDAKVFLLPYDGPPERANIVMGFCGKIAVLNCLKHDPELKFPVPEEVAGGPVDGTYGVDLGYLVWWWVYHRLIPKLKTLGFIDGQLQLDGEILLGIYDRLFEIDVNFSITEHQEFTAIGAGAQIALGAMGAMHLVSRAHAHVENNICNITTERKILFALQAANKYCFKVGYPFLILHNSPEER